MRTYLRERQIQTLEELTKQGNGNAQFILLSGRRNVGKTALLHEYLVDRQGIYLTITKKAMQVQLNDISDLLRKLQFSAGFIPSFRNWREFFEFIFYAAKERQVLLAIDEFQNFERADANFIADFTGLWDSHSAGSGLTIIASVSSTDFVQNAFKTGNGASSNLPTASLTIEPFSFSEIIKLYELNESPLTVKEIFRIYAVFGGLPKYYALIDQFKLWGQEIESVLSALVLRQFAPLGFELKEMLVSEFSRNNSTYLSILQAIALGNETVTEIAATVSIPATSAMKYITELERKKSLIRRKNPVGTTDPSRSKYGRYYIANAFENFWFRFIQPDRMNYETGKFEEISLRLQEQLSSYLQERLMMVLREIFTENTKHPMVKNLLQNNPTEVGQAWTREVKFDLAALNAETETLVVGRIPQNHLEFTGQWVERFITDSRYLSKLYQGFSIEKFVLAVETPPGAAAAELERKGIKFATVDQILAIVPYKQKRVKTIRRTEPIVPAEKKKVALQTERRLK